MKLAFQKGPAKPQILFRREFSQVSIALSRNLEWNLVSHLRSRSSWTRRICEYMKVGERQFRNEPARFFKQFVVLTRETNHRVGTDGGVRQKFTNLFNFFRVVPRTIFAMHLAQDAVTARLQWHVRMLSDARRRSHQTDQVVGPIHRFDRTQPQFLDRDVL